jgi:hypothetical protein
MRFALLSAFLFAACSGELASSTGQKHARESDPNTRPEWLTCRADAIAALPGKLSVGCTGQALAPLGYNAIVDVHTASGTQLSPLILERPGASQLLEVNASDLPLSLKAQVAFFVTDGQDGLGNLHYLEQSSTLGDDPFVVRMPVDIWSLRLTSADAVKLKWSYALDVRPLAAEDGQSSITIEDHHDLAAGAPLDLVLAVPAGARSLAIDVDGRAAPLLFDGPGSWRITPTGAVHDTSPSPAPGVQPSPMPSVPPSPMPSVPPPTCGAEGQARCVDSSGALSCLDGFVWTGSVCTACGKESQPRCADSSGALHCVDGFVWTGSVCTACGKEGQPRCADSSGALSCSANFVWNGSICTACGAEGDPRCYDAPTNTLSCFPSFVWTGSVCTACGVEGDPRCYDAPTDTLSCSFGFVWTGAICTACGRAGQPRCYDAASATYFCLDGLIWDGNACN